MTTGAALGWLVALLGAVGLAGALAVRRALRDVGREHAVLLERADELTRGEKALAEYTQAVHEWEGRLFQVAVCGCDPHTLDRPVRPDRTPPRAPRPGRPPTRRG